MAFSIKSGDADMTHGSISSELLKFAIPMAIGLLFQQLYNTVDAMVVGQYVGKAALAAVGSTASIVNMLIGLFAGLSTGAGVVISQAYGAKAEKRLSEAVQTTITLTFILSAVATIIGILIVDPMLRLMDTPEDVLPEAKAYLTIYFAGSTGLLFYNMGSGILRAVGDSRRPLYFLCFAAIVNVVFDLLFVVGFRMGVEGAAYATIISELLSALLVMYVLTKTDAPYAIKWKSLSLHFSAVKQIFSIGFPSSIQQALTSFSNVFVQSYINFFQTDCMAGYSSYNKLDAFILIPVQSLALASSTFVGQNYGAGQLKRGRDGVKKTLYMSIIVTAALTVLTMIFSGPLLSLFNDDPGVIEYGKKFVLIISPFYVTICFNQVFAGALRGIGRSTAPMIIMLLSFVAFRQLFLYCNKVFFGHSFIGTALAYPMGWVVCSILMIICYKRSALGKASDDAAGAVVK